MISVTNARHHSDDGLIQIARYVLNSLSSTISNLKVTVGPTSIVFAIPEAQFNQSKTLLTEIQQCAMNYGQRIAVAISPGVGRVIPGSGWTTESFESGTAIELCRITSELAPGSLAIPDRQSVIELLKPLSRSLTEQVRIRGKRDEVFDALVSDGYFGKHAGTTTSSANNSTVPTTSLDARPIDAWSLPVLYRQPGVFLQIQHKKRIGLNQKNRILVAKLIRELLEECPEVLDVFFLAVNAIELLGAHNTKIDAVVNALVPINQSRRHEHETPLYVFRKIATYWVDHSQKIELADHQDRVRVIRDLHAKKDRPVDTLAEISLQALVGKLNFKNRNFIYLFNEELEKRVVAGKPTDR